MARTRDFLYCAATIALMACFAATAYAPVGLSPILIDQSVRPGARMKLAVSISNDTDAKQRVVVKVYDMTLSSEGVPDVVQNSDRGISTWVKGIKPGENFDIDAKGAKQIEVDLQVPPSATGGYYGLIEVTFQPPVDAVGRGPVLAIGQRIYSAVLVTVKGKTVEQKIETGAMFITTGKEDERKPWQAAIGIKNIGNLHCRLTGDLVIRSGGAVIERATLASGRGLVLPGMTRPFVAQGTKLLPDGIYLAMAEVRLVGTSRRSLRVARSVTFGVMGGRVLPKEPTPELKAYLDSISPGFMVMNTDIETQMPPKGRRTQTIEVKNLTDKEIEVSAALQDWWRNPDGTLKFAPKLDEQTRSAVSMCTVDPDKTTLAPHGSARFVLTVNVPDKSDGEYFCGILFRRTGMADPKDPEIILQQTALVSALAQKTERYEGVIEKAEPVLNGDGSTDVLVTVANRGNVLDYPEGLVRISSLKGDAVAEPISFGDPDGLLPGTKLAIKASCPFRLQPGLYKAEVSVTWKKSQKTVREQVTFTVNETQPVLKPDKTPKGT